MAIDRKTLAKLRKRLPFGYTKATQELLRKKGIERGISAISAVARGVAYNEEVIATLIEVAEAHEARMRLMAQRIKRRKTAKP